MGAAASVNNTETTRNEFMLQRQKPVNGTDVKGSAIKRFYIITI